ncbi:Protein CBG22140, partial [Caenorhabditis briggsae]
LTTDSKDCGRIGKLFEDNFLFKECLWSYTKEDVIQKITALPAGVSMEFSLESAKRAIHGQIEYIVSIAGPGMDKIQAQFVYCPFTNDLKSGNVPKFKFKTLNILDLLLPTVQIPIESKIA